MRRNIYFVLGLLLVGLSMAAYAAVDCEALKSRHETSSLNSEEEALYTYCLSREELGVGLRSATSLSYGEKGFTYRIGGYEVDAGSFFGDLGAIAAQAQSSPFLPSTVAALQTQSVQTYIGQFEKLANDSIFEQSGINASLGLELSGLEKTLSGFVDVESTQWGAERLKQHKGIEQQLQSQMDGKALEGSKLRLDDTTSDSGGFVNVDAIQERFHQLMTNREFDELQSEVRVQVHQALTVLDLGIDQGAFGKKVLQDFGQNFSQSFFTTESYQEAVHRGDTCGFGSFASQQLSLAAMDQLQRGNKAEAKQLLMFAGDLYTSFCPGVNDARDLTEFLTGKNLLTGDQLTTFERSLSLVGLVVGSGPVYRKGASYFKRLLELDTPAALGARHVLNDSTKVRFFGFGLEDRGPLSTILVSKNGTATVADTFERGRYIQRNPKSPQRFLRYFDGADTGSIEKGSYWTTVRYNSPEEARRALGLDPSRNRALRWVEVEVTPNITIFEGTAARHLEFGGGGPQTFIHHDDVKQLRVVGNGEF